MMAGAWCVVVGSAITRPEIRLLPTLSTRSSVRKIQALLSESILAGLASRRDWSIERATFTFQRAFLQELAEVARPSPPQPPRRSIKSFYLRARRV